VQEIKEASVELCKHIMRAVVQDIEARIEAVATEAGEGGGGGGGDVGSGGGEVTESESHQDVDARHKKEKMLLEKAVQFSFRCHQFAGGFDGEANSLFARACELLELRLAPS